MPEAPPLDLLAILHAAHAAEDEVESKLNAIGLSLAKLLALKALSHDSSVFKRTESFAR